MVRVYSGDDHVDFGLEEIQAMTAGNVIERIKPGQANSHLSIMGARIAEDELLSTVEDLTEHDVLRVICSEPLPSTSIVHSENRVGEVRRMLAEFSRNDMVHAVSSLMETMFDPDFLKKQIEAMPELRHDGEACQVLNDYFLCTAYLKEDEERKVTNDWLAEHPLFVDALHRLLTKHRSAMPRNSSFMRQQTQQQQQAGGNPAGGPVVPAISADQFRDAMMAAFGSAGNFNLPGFGGAAGVANPFAAAPAAPQPPVAAVQPQLQMEELRNRYANQLQQMHEFGFMDDEQNITVLVSTNGNVEEALSLIVAMNEE